MSKPAGMHCLSSNLLSTSAVCFHSHIWHLICILVPLWDKGIGFCACMGRAGSGYPKVVVVQEQDAEVASCLLWVMT